MLTFLHRQNEFLTYVKYLCEIKECLTYTIKIMFIVFFSLKNIYVFDDASHIDWR